MKKNDKEKKVINAFKIIFIILFMAFITIYISQKTGYYEYEQHKKTVFTKEQIKKFEQDVAAGKDVRIEDYMETNTNNYNNVFSNMGYSFSNTLSKYVKYTIEGTFNFINKWIEEE